MKPIREHVFRMWKYATVSYRGMNEATEKKEVSTPTSELESQQWSVVSFDECEASGLTYPAAADMMAELEAAGVYGLCIVTDDAAKRISDSQSQA